MVVTDLLNYGIDFLKCCELPIIDYGSISLYEILWGYIVVGVLFELFRDFIG